MLLTVCPILRSLGVKAHTSEHLLLPTQPASAALTQHIIRRIEALSSQDQAYRRRNKYVPKIPLRDVASLNFRGCHMSRRGSTGVPILRVYMSLLHSPAHGRTPSCDKVVPAATKLQYCYWFPSAAAVPQALSAHQSLWRDDWACIPAQTLDLLGAA